MFMVSNAKPKNMVLKLMIRGK